jgi:hypothetical protein
MAAGDAPAPGADLTDAAPGGPAAPRAPAAVPPRRRPAPWTWRRVNRVVHRDAGYLVAGLTLLYAISGVAVNHRHDWNPSWKIARETQRFEPLPVTDRETMAAALVQALDLPGPPRSSFRRAPERIELFYDGWTVEADVAAGVATVTRPRERWVLRDSNYLHLNEPKGAWTWFADAFSVLLGVLAITGLFVLRGATGLGGRGKWLVMAGLLPVVVFLVLRRL